VNKYLDGYWITRVRAMIVILKKKKKQLPPLLPCPLPPLREACHMHFAVMGDGSGQDIRLRALLYIVNLMHDDVANYSKPACSNSMSKPVYQSIRSHLRAHYKVP